MIYHFLDPYTAIQLWSFNSQYTPATNSVQSENEGALEETWG